ncbi:hypothetical protein P154DRAFT_479144 [Amniculicola lignicola CBS 123094]|uniref:Heterokaryon incompatibility domain-containing protein n=1 Tax=Amniculicola lignicola CBS 123094 TaxID=1392246 RepID=A0A6A5X4W2_9PLEO|nr:hypothetical protein P154DRAFT_479144 [Amniculicola lignicola CBS 123094]
MRLLKHASGKDCVLIKEFADNDEIPPYAILSHTWIDDEEVTFDELTNGTGKSKMGFKKIQLCGQQAQRDNLEYFWVDTCCIIQSHHRRQCTTKRVAYAARSCSRTYIAF